MLPPNAEVARRIAEVARADQQGVDEPVVYVTVAATANEPADVLAAVKGWTRALEDALHAAGFALARNRAPKDPPPPRYPTSDGPTRFPEDPKPAPHVVLFAGVDLVAQPPTLTFWFVSPEDYAKSSAYGPSRGKQVVELG